MRITAFLVVLVTIILTVFMVANPRETIAGASYGFSLWYTTVLPSLFPFFIAAEVLVGSGFIKVLGKWLEPIMRPIFNLPGASSLVVVMGFTSGFPMGAILTRRLYEQQLLNADEAERLVSFTNNCSPLFIVGAVGVGMLGNPFLGYLLAAGHYLSNLIVGFLWRFRPYPSSLRNIVQTQAGVYPSQTEDKEGEVLKVGRLLGNSVNQALNNILAVGGFIVLFSVLTRMLSYWGIIDILAATLTKLLSICNLSYSLAYGLCIGFFEITLGSKTAITAETPSLLATLLVVSIILAWSGLSIIAQITSILTGLPIRLSFYLFARFMQMFVAMGIVTLYLHWVPASTIAVFQPSFPVYKILYSCNAWKISIYSMLAGLIVILMMLLLAWLIRSKDHPANQA